MRAKNFFLLAQTNTVDGTLQSFGVTGSNSEIGATNTTFQFSMIDSDYNTFISDRTVSDASVAVQFSKSAVSGSNDVIDTFILAARG